MRFVADFPSFRAAFVALAATLGANAARADVELLYYSSRNPSLPNRPDLVRPRNDLVEVPFTLKEVRPLWRNRSERKWIEDYVATEMKDELIAFLRSDEFRGLRESSGSPWMPLAAVPLEDLIADLRASPFRTKKECRDSYGEPRDGTAELGARGGEICIAAGRMITRGKEAWFEADRKAELFGLAVHEVLHHFGYWDADNAIYAAFASRAKFYLMMALPAPSRVVVSDAFAAWREAIREGETPTADEAGATLSECRLEILDDGLSERERTTLLPHYRAFFARPIRVATSAIDPRLFSVRAENPPIAPFAPPTGARLVSFGNWGAWAFTGSGFRTEDGDLVARLIARRAPDGDVIVELAMNPNAESAKVALPSALPGDARTFGYARCKSTLGLAAR